MDEFIVSYEKENGKIYSVEFTLNEIIDGCNFDEICDCTLSKNDKIICMNRYIGKKDINNKKIFENYSIVKFSVILDSVKMECIGYFRYSEYKLGYVINITSGTGGVVEYDWRTIKDIKIIGTIKENKKLLEMR